MNLINKRKKGIKNLISLILSIMMVLSVVTIPTYNKMEKVEAATVPITGQLVVDTARKYIGPMPYISGGMDLSVGCDCSGFVCAIYRLCGVDFVSKYVRSSYDMMNNYSKINGVKLKTTSISDIRNGDLIITNSGGHVGIGTDRGTMIHQSNSRLNAIQEVSLADYTGSSSAIVMIIRIDYSKWGGTNAANAPLDVTPSSGDNGNNNNQNIPATENPGDPYAVPTADVLSGSTSQAGKWVQTALNKVENAGLEVDGNLGAISTAAIKTFQGKYGLTQSGNADMATINKLVELYKALNSVTSVSIVEAKEQGISLDEGKTFQLTAKYSPDTVKNVTLTWESSNKDVAEVSSTGLVTGTGGGDANITVKTANGKSASVKFKVAAKPRKNEWRRGKWYGADGKQTYEYIGSWKSSSKGWWFGDTSGWYAKETWMKIDDEWYYFNSNGYMVKGWQSIKGTYYYFEKTGEMVESEWIEGYWLSAGGAWSYTAVGSWKQNSTGWWFEDTAGWYPKNETIKIDGVNYQFDKNGYWVKNGTANTTSNSDKNSTKTVTSSMNTMDSDSSGTDATDVVDSNDNINSTTNSTTNSIEVIDDSSDAESTGNASDSADSDEIKDIY